MPKPPNTTKGARTRSKTCNLTVPRNLASTQYLKAKSPQLATAVLRLAESLTLLPYNRPASRLVDRALIAAEEGRRYDL